MFLRSSTWIKFQIFFEVSPCWKVSANPHTPPRGNKINSWMTRGIFPLCVLCAVVEVVMTSINRTNELLESNERKQAARSLRPSMIPLWLSVMGLDFDDFSSLYDTFIYDTDRYRPYPVQLTARSHLFDMPYFELPNADWWVYSTVTGWYYNYLKLELIVHYYITGPLTTVYR